MNIAIAGYKSLERICESTNTALYRAYREDQTAIAIKTLKTEYPSIEEFTYLKHEYKILQELEIKGLIKPFALEHYQNGLALLCEDLIGESLKKIIAEQQIELSHFLRIAIQLVTTIAELHQNYIIHKDIQPRNILINAQTGQVNIIDVSLSSCLLREERFIQHLDLLKGNLAYMSPEQTGRMNRSLDYRTDFYSLGVTFYEMLTGQLPFQTNNPLELIHCHIAKAALPPIEINSEIPPVLSDIVMKLLAKTAEERYQSALGLKADLENCLKMLQTTGEVSHFAAGQIDLCSQLLIPQKLYGREREVTTLIAAFERISQGATEIVLVSGYSGIGKSSLVNEIHKPIVGARGYFISGKFDQLKRNIPYASLIQAFQELIRQLLTESNEAIATWRAKLEAALGANGQIIIDVIPEVEKIIGLQPAVPSLGATESQNRFNRVFQQFIRVFTQPEHPLVIFLDDLQWVDLASLKLIQLLVCNRNLQYLLLIGAYRDNEVNASHPLMLTLEELQQTGATVNRIILQPLQISHVEQLVSDTLHSDISKITPLAELVFHKTEGNPFFLTQLLKSLYQEKLLFFNFDRGCWQWKMQRLQGIEIAENVVELMVNQIQKLSRTTQNVLKFAACIGNKFTLEVLAIVNEKSLSATAIELWEALQAGLILPLSEAYKIPLVLESDTSNVQVEALKVEYKFLHDRVQQAAYLLIPESQKKATHLKIGRLLLQNASLEDRKENIFNLVNQLNYGVELLAVESEKYEIAELNLIAGQKAKAATAYESAMRYFKVGLELVTNSWHRQYELSIALHQEAAEVAFLSGDFEQMEQLAEVVLQQAKTQLDKVKIYELQIKTCEVQRKLLEAVKLGLQALEILGVKLPESPTSIDVRQAIDATTATLAEKKIEDLSHLPPMTDANKLAAFRLIASLVPAAYQSAPSLFILIACQQVNLSISDGNTPLSASGFADYGIVFSGLLEDIETAYQFGQLALNILERLDAREVRSQTLFKVATFVLHWKHHVRETLPLLEDAYSSGLENGDLGHAGYSASHKCQYSYWSGLELKSLEREMASYGRAIAQINQETALKWHQIFHQVVLNLMGLAENPCHLIGEAYNEDRFLPFHIQLNERTAIHYVFLNKLILCYLFGEFAQAVENANKAEQYLDGVRELLAVPLFYFYDSLARLAIYPSLPRSPQKFCLNQVNNNQGKMQRWAKYAPMNFRHKYELVEAEKARVLGQYWQAMEHYDRAIAAAIEHGYIQEEALANELAAKFYFSQGKDKIARIYLVESYYGYLRWEATAKVKDLEAKYPQVFAPILKPEQSGETNTASSHTSLDLKNLDLATVMKASQALSEEIVFSNLLTKLMQIVIENAGAEKGFLLLEQAGELFVKASGGDTDDSVQRSLPVKLLATDRLLPISAIDYVARTQESIVLHDATAEEIFAADPYIIARQPRSILCTPILHQGRLTGILYLENNLTTGAFTPDRLEVLQLLAAQAAISFENARLYNDLEEYNRTLEAKVTERTLELQQEIRVRQRAESAAAAANCAKSQFLANMSHELRTPLNGILGYAQILGKESTLTERQKNGLDVIYRCGDRMLTLIEDILDLSKIEAQKMELYPHTFHLPKFLAEIVDICRLRAEQKQISLTYETLSIPEFVRADEKRLRQVLLNLLGNAVKFTDKGGVIFRVSDRAGKLRFQVEDTGTGIAAEQLEEIFLPFQQVGEQHRHTEGTGLGLAIGRQLVQMMGSDIEVKSTLGKGSVFWFDLDLAHTCHAEIVSVEKARKIIGFQGDKRKILVVDDRESNRFVLVNLLQPLGFEVLEAIDGLDCLAKAREFQPDCICMDLVMPGTDGFEATRRIRTMPELAGVVVIAISASVFERDRQQSQIVGCDGFLPKPVREADLLELLRNHLDLEWIYEEEIAAKSLNNVRQEEMTATAIVPPPAAEMAVLLDLAMMGDIQGILEQTARIEASDRQWIPFAAHLRQLARGFKEKQILEFIRKYS